MIDEEGNEVDREPLWWCVFVCGCTTAVLAVLAAAVLGVFG